MTRRPLNAGGQPIPWMPQRLPTHPGEIDARRALAAMPYQQYLNTRHWRWRRRRALWLADDRCEHCGRQPFDRTELVDLDETDEYAFERLKVRRARFARWLEVHHLTYDRRGCEDDDDLIVLCDQCHELAHTLPVDAVRAWRRWRAS
jgi:hypothetical protein